jgi:hypothetical protein
LIVTYIELGLHRTVESPFPGDILFFLHTVPWMAAVALAPHTRKMRETLRYGFIDLLLLAIMWLYIYVFMAMPWKTVVMDPELFRLRDLQVYMLENLIVLGGFAFFSFRAKGNWRIVYLNLFGAVFLYNLGLAGSYWADARGTAYPANLFDLPVIASFLWLGTAGIIARRLAPEPDAAPEPIRRDTQWPAQCAMLAVLAAPVFAYWAVFVSDAPPVVRNFRLLATLAALFVGTALVFFRQHLVYQERTGLVQELWDSLENVKRLQTHFVQSEKLASLGQLAAGAAHEINNPLTAILGYADVLIEESPAQTRPHTLGEKIREQARRPGCA